MQVIVDPHPEEIVAREVEHASAAALASRGRLTIALTGGSIATTCYPRLARATIDPARTHVFWGDERAVPPDHPESNCALARSLWLDRIAIDPAHVHRMPADRPDLDAAAADHERELRRVLGDRGLDVALLGVGPDGHVCSLFPGHPLLEEQHRWVAAVHDAPKPPPRRMTLTLPALAATELVIVVALGAAKAAVAREAIEDPTSSLPVARALRGAKRAIVILDPPAASALRA